MVPLENQSAVPYVGVSKLRLKFPGSAELLFDDLTFQARRGEKVLLLGPSGCGKSTLLQVLSGLIPGAIEVPMRHAGLECPASWGYLFQDPDAQFCMPYADEELAFVMENLQVSRELMPARIGQLLQEVGLALEDVHTPIGEMSGGMKQRLAMASLLALEPDVWFLDEPTSLLDPEGTSEVWETVKRVTEGKTVLIVEHKIDEIVDFVDRVVLFDKAGRVIADGEPQAVFREHRGELRQYGIWYPGVWDDYDAQRSEFAPGRKPPASSGQGADPVVRLQDFSGYYGIEKKIGIPSAEVYPGDWVTVVGNNGAGKSTLLSALMQLIPTTGAYELNGIEVGGLNDVMDTAAYVFQNPELQFVANSVFDEVAFNFRRDGEAEAEIKAKTEALLAWYGLEQHQKLHPYQLSLGQKRRLSVAAATVKKQAVLLLDEPTFGQDAASTFALLEKLEEWRIKGAAIVMVTHDPQIVRRYATRIWEVSEGRLISDLPQAPYSFTPAAIQEPERIRS